MKNIGVIVNVDEKGIVTASLDVPDGLPPGNYTGTIEAVVVEESLRLGDRVYFKNRPLAIGESPSLDYGLRESNTGTILDIGVGEKRGSYVVEWDGPFRSDGNGNPDHEHRTVMLHGKHLEVIENEGQ